MDLKSPLEKNFDLKKPLFTESQALVEANRCLYCYDAPCIKACPTSIDIPSFIKGIANQNVAQSAHVILRENMLGYSCARVCPVEVLCAETCVMHLKGEEPIQIGRLQHFATHHALEHHTLAQLMETPKPATGMRIACVGAGPASLALAGLMTLKGHRVEIFEARSFCGGLNASGIAPYKMQFSDAQKEISWLRDLGVIIHENAPVDSSDFLLTHFDAIFFGFGIGEDATLDFIPASHPRIFGATELIRNIKTDLSFSLKGIARAHILGGGNTAIDVAHELALLGIREVTLVYRGPPEKLSAYKHEVEAARKDGVHILYNHQPVHVEALADGNLHVQFEATSTETDLLVMAIGQNRHMGTASLFDGVELTERGLVKIDFATHRTGNAKVWAGGDCTNGGKEVVNAVADAKLAATSMHEYLTMIAKESNCG